MKHLLVLGEPLALCDLGCSHVISLQFPYLEDKGIEVDNLSICFQDQVLE